MAANIKTVRSDLGSTGTALVMDVQRVADNFFYDFVDGEFRAIPGTQNVVVTEPSPYRYEGSTLAIGTKWNDGQYIFRFKAAVTFIPVSADIQEVINDNLVTESNTVFSYFKTLSDILGKILSKLMGA